MKINTLFINNLAAYQIFFSGDKKYKNFSAKTLPAEDTYVSLKQERPPCTFELKKVKGLCCAACGNDVVTYEESKDFQNLIENAKGKQLRNILQSRQRLYNGNEQKIVTKLLGLSSQHEDKNIQQLFQVAFEDSRKILVQKQIETLYKLKRLSKLVQNPEHKRNLKEFIDNMIELAQSRDKIFKRKDVIYELNKILKAANSEADRAVLGTTIKYANYLPTSFNNEHAFIVKYSRRRPGEIASMLLSPRMSTAEHIKPYSLEASDDKNNYIIECKKCNQERGNILFADWIKMNPQILQNIKKFIAKTINAIKSGKVENFEDYPIKVNETLKERSAGLIYFYLDDYQKSIRQDKEKTG
ncbi:MAG: HNH endonuclease domain-containing protein [Candidatus Gastranaerophilales bacterium]|nr:HNH endonuclease domain-containing protein [Candidatus Gastranaerophilales bacterium]